MCYILTLGDVLQKKKSNQQNQSHILLVEYKNANISGAAHPERFAPAGGDKLANVAKKFYDSSHWLYLMGKGAVKKVL